MPTPTPKWYPASDKVLTAWANRMDEMHVAATRADARVQTRIAELRDHFKRHPIAYADETVRRNKVIDDYARSDAQDDYNYSVGEELRMATRIAAEFQLRQMMRVDRQS